MSSLSFLNLSFLQDLVNKLGLFKAKAPKSLRRIAVDLRQSHILVLAVEKKGIALEITHFRSEPRLESVEAVANQLREIFKQEGLETQGVRTLLKGQGVVIRHLTFPQMKKEEFASAIQYEAEKYIPFKTAETILDFHILAENIVRGNSKFMEVLLVAAKLSEISQLLSIFQKAGLEVELIDVAILSIANLLELVCNEAKERVIGFLDMGTEICTFGVLSHGKPLFVRDISFGETDILKFLERKLGLSQEEAFKIQKDISQASPEYKQAVEQVFASFMSEFKLSLNYYLDRVPGADLIQTLFIMGGGFRFLPDHEFVEKQVQIPIKRVGLLSFAETLSKLDQAFLKDNEDIILPALGLCLR